MNWPGGRATLRLTKLMAMRAWQQQGRSISLAALGAGALLGFGTLLASGGVNGLPETLPAAVLALASVTRQGQWQEINTFMVAMSPVLLSLLCALLATVITPSIVSEDVRGGTLETLLATPVSKSALFHAYFGAAALLTLFCWALCSLALVSTWALLTLALPLQLSITFPLASLLVLLPLCLTLWSAAVTLSASLLFPATLDSNAGINGGPARLLALLPSLVLVPATVLGSQAAGPLMLGSLTFSVLAAAALLYLTAKRFRMVTALS